MPTVDQARFGVYWVLDHTIKLAPGGVGGPIKMSELPKTMERGAHLSYPTRKNRLSTLASLRNTSENLL
jgi:hypothetical protein